jgi:hypothetical protein
MSQIKIPDVLINDEPAQTDTDELHAELVDEVDATDDTDAVESEPEPEQASNPIPAQRLAEQIQTELPPDEQPPAKRGRGRPRKAAPEPPPAPEPAPEPPAKPAASRSKKAAKPPLPDIGAAVAPQLDAKRREQLDAVKGLLQLQASKIASLACLAVGWDPLNSEESVLVDAEFEGWTPPEEMRKFVVVGIVALPRALGDNRVRRAIGMPLLGAAGDAPAARAAEVAASVQPPPPVVEPVQPTPPVSQPEPQRVDDELRSADVTAAVSPIFAAAGPVRVPKGFM